MNTSASNAVEFEQQAVNLQVALCDMVRRHREGEIQQLLSVDVFTGAHAEIAQQVNALVGLHVELVRRMSIASERFNAAAGEIAADCAQLSECTDAQSGSASKVAAGMKALSAELNLNAQRVRQARQLATDAVNVAAKGCAIVSEVVDALNAVESKSRKISNINRVVDGIAQQLDALAMNATLEAVHAGEHGRGIALVAEEVRNLARYSAVAAKEIRGLIGESAAKVATGSRLANRAGKNMKESDSSARRVIDIVAQISSVAQNHRVAIQQASVEMSWLAGLARRSAACVTKSADRSWNLAAQAHSLAGSMLKFKLGDETRLCSYVPIPKRKVPSDYRTKLTMPLSESGAERPVGGVLRLVGGYGGDAKSLQEYRVDSQ